MGWNDHMPDLEGEAVAIALQAGAISACPLHSSVTLDQGDPEANSRAYAIGTNRWKVGDLLCDREEFMDAIKEAIEMSGDGCPECERLRDA